MNGPAVAAAAIAAMFIGPAHGETIERMPYIRAWAYAQAIQKYCFAGPVDERLANAAREQANLITKSRRRSETELLGARKVADEHLRIDRAACDPAAAFVVKVITALPDAELGRLTAERKAELATNAAGWKVLVDDY